MVQVKNVQTLNSMLSVEAKTKDSELKTKEAELLFPSSVETKSISYGYSENHIRDLEEKIKAKKEELAIYQKDLKNGTDRGMEILVEDDVRQSMEESSFFAGLDVATTIVGGMGGGLLISDFISKKPKKRSLAIVGGALGMFIAKHLSKLIVPKVLAKQRTTEGSSLNNFYKETLPARIKRAEAEISKLEQELASIDKPKKILV